MHFETTVLVTFLAASLAAAQQNINVGASPQQTANYLSDIVSFIKSEASSPQVTALGKEIDPFLPNPVAFTKILQSALPTDAAELKVFATHPLAFATAKPQPKFVQDMPPKVRSDYLSFVHSVFRAEASIANKDLFGGNGGNAAPNVLPGLGWVLGGAAGVVGVVAVML